MRVERDSWEFMDNNSIAVGPGWIASQTEKALLVDANTADGLGHFKFWIPKAFTSENFFTGATILRLPACLKLTLFAQKRQGRKFVRTEEVSMTGEEFFAASAKFCEA